MFRIVVVLVALIFVATLSISSKSSAAKKRSAYISVAAGSMDRKESIVSFTLPAEFKGTSYALQDNSARRFRMLPLQVNAQRQATFVLPELAAGKTKTYRLIEIKPGARKPAVRAETANSSQLQLNLAGRKVLSFVTQPIKPAGEIKPVFLRAGYIHPIYTPSGRMVTDDYPSDHYHHHGIWFAWTKTEFEGGHPDFWNVADGTGRVEFVSLDETWNGEVYAGFKSRQQYVALTGSAPKTALNEGWEVRLYNVGQGANRYSMFDVVATQQCATASPLILDEYRYGGMGVRGHRDWKDKTKMAFLTSEGKTRQDGNATRGRWCHMGGPVDGQPVGIAILDHPGNLRAPTPMRLNPDDPFFNYAPSQMGRFEIKPGEEFVLRYRYLVADGSPNTAEINRIWNDFAFPPVVTVALK